MRHSADVIAQVVNGLGPKLAEVMELSESRCYEILSTDNPYPKAKRLIRAIAQVNREGCRLIKADMDSLFVDILGECREVDITDLTRESFEANQSVLECKPLSVQKNEIREAIAAYESKLEALERPVIISHETRDMTKAAMNTVPGYKERNAK